MPNPVYLPRSEWLKNGNEPEAILSADVIEPQLLV